MHRPVAGSFLQEAGPGPAPAPGNVYSQILKNQELIQSL